MSQLLLGSRLAKKFETILSSGSTDIDTTISESLFKSDDDDGRRNAMLNLIDLKWVLHKIRIPSKATK